MANGYNFKVISYKTYMKVVGGGAIRGGGGETGGPGIKRYDISYVYIHHMYTYIIHI